MDSKGNPDDNRRAKTVIRVDENGAITLPHIMMNSLNWRAGIALDVRLNEFGVDITTKTPGCFYCGGYRGPFYEFGGHSICVACKEQISDLNVLIEDSDREQIDA